MKQETKTSSEEIKDPEYKLHENGSMYREVEFKGLDEPLKLFTSIKPGRLEGESYNEYQFRRILIKRNEKMKEPEYIHKNTSNPLEKNVPYVNPNKKDKFKKKKK